MLVYRIENDEGDGMYCCADIDLSFTEVMANYPDPDPDRRIMQSEFYELYGIEYGDVHILPEADFPGFWEKNGTQFWDYYFGFPSTDALKLWIYREEWRKALHDNGFFIAVYDDVHEKVSESGRQVIFKKHQSQFLRKFSLLEI